MHLIGSSRWYAPVFSNTGVALVWYMHVLMVCIVRMAFSMWFPLKQIMFSMVRIESAFRFLLCVAFLTQTVHFALIYLHSRCSFHLVKWVVCSRWGEGSDFRHCQRHDKVSGHSLWLLFSPKLLRKCWCRFGTLWEARNVINSMNFVFLVFSGVAFDVLSS